MMDLPLGLIFFFKSQIFVRGGTLVQFFSKSFILTSWFQKGVCQAPITSRFGAMVLQSFSIYGLIRHSLWTTIFRKISGKIWDSLWVTIFCKMKAARNCLWVTIFCKMKAARNHVWENLTHGLWTRNISILTLRKFFRFSLSHTHTHILSSDIVSGRQISSHT